MGYKGIRGTEEIRRRILLASGLLGIFLVSTGTLLAKDDSTLYSWDSLYAKYSWKTFEALPEVQDTLDFNNLDLGLLNAAVFFVSCRKREAQGGKPFSFSKALRNTANYHTRQMAKHGFVSHYNWRNWRYSTPERRSNQFKSSLAAENVASAFLYAYEAGTRYIIKRRNGVPNFHRDEDHTKILRHTYLSFAEDLVERWMDSPGHRKNLLDPSMVRLGCAVWIGEGELEVAEIPLAYCTQDFGR